jgi:phage baseplate assembly protein W
MNGRFLKIPFDLKKIMTTNQVDSVDLSLSVSQHINLIIHTHFGEHRANKKYGCEIWNLDFELIVSDSLWEEKFRKSLLSSIMSYEHRLNNVEVEIKMEELEIFNKANNTVEVKKKVNIYVTGQLVETGQFYKFNSAIFLSPLSSI